MEKSVMKTEKITPANYSEWLVANNPKSVAIVCTDGYGDVELAKAIKGYNNNIHVHLFEPGNFLKEDATLFEFIMLGHDFNDQSLSRLQPGEFVLR
jgi:hypothetical protein